MNRISLTILSGLIVLAALGCGNGDSSFELTPVKGRVTLNGEPLADADVAFHFQGDPPDGYDGAFGKTNQLGEFELITKLRSGCLPGRHKVTVRAAAKPNSAAVVGGVQDKTTESRVEVVPEAYGSVETTDLSIEVTTDKSEGYNIELTAK